VYNSPSYSSYKPHHSYVSNGDLAQYYQTYQATGGHARSGRHSILSTKRFLIRDGQRIPIDEYTSPQEKAIASTLLATKRFLIQDGQRIPIDEYTGPDEKIPHATKRFLIQDGQRIPIDEYTGPDEKFIADELEQGHAVISGM